MKYLRILAIFGLFLGTASVASAQRVVVGVGVGAPVLAGPPVCSYGYYNYYPYACAPYGFYGPSWFSGGIFIGAGPWFHGYRGGFYGRPGFGRPGFGGRPGWGGRPGFGGREVGRGPVGRGPEGNFHGGGAVRGGGGSFHGGAVHGGGGSHGGGRR